MKLEIKNCWARYQHISFGFSYIWKKEIATRWIIGLIFLEIYIEKGETHGRTKSNN